MFFSLSNSAYAKKTKVFTNIYIKNIEQVFVVCVGFFFSSMYSLSYQWYYERVYVTNAKVKCFCCSCFVVHRFSSPFFIVCLNNNTASRGRETFRYVKQKTRFPKQVWAHETHSQMVVSSGECVCWMEFGWVDGKRLALIAGDFLLFLDQDDICSFVSDGSFYHRLNLSCLALLFFFLVSLRWWKNFEG